MRRLIGIVLLVAALLQFGFRGRQRIRYELPLWDFASVYAATRNWIDGGNPYDRGQVIATWEKSDVFGRRDVSYFATVYPPSSLLLVTPFSLMPASVAMSAWLLITLLLLALQFACLADMAQLKWDDPRALILIGASLASAPFQFGVLSGQLSMPAISACIAAVWFASRDRVRVAGLIIGIACALKPQVGAAFVIFYLARRRWNVVAAAIVCGGVIAIASLVAMHASHIDWINGWRQSVAATQRIGGVNDYGWTAEYRDEIVDLKMLLVSAIHRPQLLKALVGSIVLILLGWFGWVFPRETPGQETRFEVKRHLLTIGALCAILLLPIYHRVYDASLLSIALAWALAELDGAWRRSAMALLIPMAIFLIPFDAVSPVARRIGALSALSKTGFWQSVIAPYYAWGLIGVTLGLLLSMTGAYRGLPGDRNVPLGGER